MSAFGAAEKEAVEKLLKSGDLVGGLLTLVAEAFAAAGRAAAEAGQRRVAHTPRNLTARQLRIVDDAFRQMGMADDTLLQGARRLSSWAVDQYAKVALTIKPYGELVSFTKPLNDSVVALMSFDADALRRADEAVGAVARATRAAAPTAASRSALAQIEFVLDSHHIVEAQWFEKFATQFEKSALGWKSVDDMSAVAIPVDVHQRNLRSLMAKLGHQGGPSPELQAGYKQVTAVLQRRLLLPDQFARLSAAERESGLFHRIEPGVTSAKELVEAHRKVYASEPGLKWLHDVVSPELDRISAALP